MGSGSVDNTSASQKIIDYLNELGAYAISLGMSAKEYWEDEPSLINLYINAEKIKQRKKNNEFWLQGLYVYIAILDSVPVLNPLSKEKKARPYLKEPVPITEEERQAQVERNIAERLDKLVGLKPKS